MIVTEIYHYVHRLHNLLYIKLIKTYITFTYKKDLSQNVKGWFHAK